MRTQFLLPVCLSVLMISLSCQSGKSLPGGWENEYLGHRKGLAFYPDNYANYWVYTFDPPRQPEMGFRIEGKLPAARYMSVNLYLHKSRQSVGSVYDARLNFSADSTFVIEVLPAGSNSHHGNALFFSPDSGRYSLFLRLYDPAIDDQGGQPLPVISPFFADGRTAPPLPHLRWNILSSKLLPSVIGNLIAIRNTQSNHYPAGQERLSLQAYRHPGTGYFPNHDNQYLILPIHLKNDELACIRFKPPHHANHRQDPSAQVRYWSLAFGLPDTRNAWTLRDVDAQVAEDGFVYLVIGDQPPLLPLPDHQFRPWQAPHRKAVLLYRHLLTHPDFSAPISAVPAYVPHPAIPNPTLEVMGEYAPQGFIVKRETPSTTIDSLWREFR